MHFTVDLFCISSPAITTISINSYLLHKSTTANNTTLTLLHFRQSEIMSLPTQRNGQTGFVQLLEQIYKRFRMEEPSDLRPAIDEYSEMVQHEAQAGGGRSRHSTLEIIRMVMDDPTHKNAIINLYRDRFLKPENAVGIAMMPHCPVSFLESLLSNPIHEDQEFTAESPSWKCSGGGIHLGTSYATTDIRWIVENIYEAYFWPFWHGKRNFWNKEFFDFAQELGAKVNLLRSGKYTDSTELKVLDNLVHAVSRIQSNIANLHNDEGFQAKYRRSASGSSYAAQSPLWLIRTTTRSVRSAAKNLATDDIALSLTQHGILELSGWNGSLISISLCAWRRTGVFLNTPHPLPESCAMT